MNDKPRYDLVPPRALTEVAHVLRHGAGKYGDDSWKEIEHGTMQQRYIRAALGHVIEYMKGNYRDEESNYSHLAHAITSLMFILEVNLHDAETQHEKLDCMLEIP